MKKLTALFLTLAMFAVFAPLTITAQTKYKKNYRSENYNTRQYNGKKKDKNFYDKHRNVINVGIGGVAGAIIGGLLGGKKGALIGAGVGAGAGAAYTYGINPKDKKKKRNNRRYYRNR